MSWQQTEFILKGVYLGLLLFVGLQLPRDAGWEAVGLVAACTLGGLVLCLGIAAVRKLREGYRVKGRLSAFILFLLLENPGLVYAGILLGLTAGAYALRTIYSTVEDDVALRMMVYTVGGGAILGYVFWLLAHADRKQRVWLGLALAVAIVGGAIAAVDYSGVQVIKDQADKLGLLLLLGIPLFYLLTFASLVEETEVEIAAICAALGVGLWTLGENLFTSSNFRIFALAIPLTLYFVYTRRVLPGLRVFKHVLRGMSYAGVGRYRPALVCLNRALELDRDNALARQTLWALHRGMDFDQLLNDPETLALVNYELCLERAGWLLLRPKPAPEQLNEAQRLLDLIASQRPALQPRVDYWRAVACTHEKDYDRAAAALESVLTSQSSEPDSPHRRAVLFPAWQMALLLSTEMRRRVGEPVLEQPGRRMEAIAAAERRLAADPNDESARELARLLYDRLTEREYQEAAKDGPATDFNHDYCRELGLACAADPAQWERGGDYLRIAARGLPAQAVGLYYQLAKAHERAGDFKGVWRNYEAAVRCGHAFGPKKLGDEERYLYFGLVKTIAEDAARHDELDRAIEFYRLYTEYERAGVETYRHLADLYQKKGDPWAALHAVEHGLSYDSKDADLLQRKDDCYYSVTPEEVAQRIDNIRKWFDVEYCKNKARWLLDKQGDNLDLLDWAEHLMKLAQAAQPGSFTVRVLRGRILRRRGEISQAVEALEEVRQNRPEKFPSNEEEESWYLACRLLGDIYLHEKPQQAVECFLEYKKSPKSGADTMYKLGVAYEQLGDRPRALRCYNQVAAFESHPLAPEANDAIRRLQQVSA